MNMFIIIKTNFLMFFKYYIVIMMVFICVSHDINLRIKFHTSTRHRGCGSIPFNKGKLIWVGWISSIGAELHGTFAPNTGAELQGTYGAYRVTAVVSANVLMLLEGLAIFLLICSIVAPISAILAPTSTIVLSNLLSKGPRSETSII